MTRNSNRFETLENAIFDFENENESFDFWEENEKDFISSFEYGYYYSDYYNDYYNDDYSPFEDDESWVDPEWYIQGFNSEADYMHHLGIISGLS